MAWTALRPSSGREPCAALPRVSNCSHKSPLCAVTTRSRVGSPTTARSALSPFAASAREPPCPFSSSTRPAKTISVRPGRRPERASSISAVSIAATLPLVSHAPRPWSRPSFSRGRKISGESPPTVSRCGASRTRWRARPEAANRTRRFGRPGKTSWNSTSSPARAALAARKSATRCSPARGSLRGKKAGFTLGSAMSSRRSLAVWLMLVPRRKLPRSLTMASAGVE